MIRDESDEVLQELFNSHKNRYKNNLESIKSSEFDFDYVHFMYCKCHKTNPNHGVTSVVSPNWIKNKKIKYEFHQ